MSSVIIGDNGFEHLPDSNPVAGGAGGGSLSDGGTVDAYTKAQSDTRYLPQIALRAVTQVQFDMMPIQPEGTFYL